MSEKDPAFVEHERMIGEWVAMGNPDPYCLDMEHTAWRHRQGLQMTNEFHDLMSAFYSKAVEHDGFPSLWLHLPGEE
jgi:hypothetical protein